MEMVQEQVLEAFLNEFRPFPEGLRPDTICQRTGIGPDALPAIRARLSDDGFVFEDDEDGRWRLATKPDRLWPYWVRAGLRCDERHWHSNPYQSLLFSVLLDLEPRETFASVLTIAISTAVARAIQDVAGVPAHIKFPNDILVRGKKVAGILLEVRDYGVPARAVAGVGINVNQLRKHLHKDVRAIATSLREERPEKERTPGSASAPWRAGKCTSATAARRSRAGSSTSRCARASSCAPPAARRSASAWSTSPTCASSDPGVTTTCATGAGRRAPR
jgi:hypothetical protein